MPQRDPREGSRSREKGKLGWRGESEEGCGIGVQGRAEQ